MNEPKPEDVMKALEWCKAQSSCEVCPYSSGELNLECTDALHNDALALLREKDAEIERLTIDLKAMRAAANSYKMALIETERKKVSHDQKTT